MGNFHMNGMRKLFLKNSRVLAMLWILYSKAHVRNNRSFAVLRTTKGGCIEGGKIKRSPLSPPSSPNGCYFINSTIE